MAASLFYCPLLEGNHRAQRGLGWFFRFLVNTLTGVTLQTSLVVFVVNESFDFELAKVIKIQFGYKLC